MQPLQLEFLAVALMAFYLILVAGGSAMLANRRLEQLLVAKGLLGAPDVRPEDVFGFQFGRRLGDVMRAAREASADDPEVRRARRTAHITQGAALVTVFLAFPLANVLVPLLDGVAAALGLPFPWLRSTFLVIGATSAIGLVRHVVAGSRGRGSS